MADHYGDKFFPPSYFPAGYFQGGEQNPGAMSASLSGSASVAAALTAPASVAEFIDLHDGISPEKRAELDREALAREQAETERRVGPRKALEKARATLDPPPAPVAVIPVPVAVPLPPVAVDFSAALKALDEARQTLNAAVEQADIEAAREAEDMAIIMLLAA